MLMNNFVKYLSNERNYSSYTIDAYSSDLVQFFKFLNLDCDASNLNSISIDRVRAWIVYLNNNSVSSKTINRKISSLKSFFNFCNREMYISINPTLKIRNLKESRKLPTVVSEKSLQDLFETSNIFKQGLIAAQYALTQRGPMAMAASLGTGFLKTAEHLETPDIQFHIQFTRNDSS